MHETHEDCFRFGFGADKMKTTNIVTLHSVRWTISYRNSLYGRLLFPDDGGNTSIVSPFLDMDGWEPAYVLDYKSVPALTYIDAFFLTINWDTLDKRLVV